MPIVPSSYYANRRFRKVGGALKVRRTTGYRRRIGYRRPMVSRNFASKVMQVTKPELKYARVFVSNHTVAFDNQLIGLLSGNAVIPAGATAITRNGDRINPVNIHFKYHLESVPATATVNNTIMTLFLVKWYGDISVDAPTSTADFLLTLNVSNSPFDPARKGKFKVLWRRVHFMSNIVGADRASVNGRCYVKTSGLITYDGATDRKGHYYLIATSNVALASGNAPVLFAEGLFRFRDV